MEWIFVLIGGVAVALIAAEYSARLYFRSLHPYAHVPHAHLNMNLHPQACPALPRRTVHYRVNSNGERASELPSSENIFRVLAVGGSAAECRLLTQERCWAIRLQALLGRPEMMPLTSGRPVHVGLVAKSQLDSTGLLYLLRNILPSYPKLDVLLIMTGLSDALRWLEDGADPGRLPAVIAPEEILVNSRKMSFQWRRPAMYRLVVRWKTQHRLQFKGSVGHGIVRETKARSGAREFSPLPQDRSIMHEHYRQNLLQLIEIGRSHAERVVLIRQPWFDKTQLSPKEQACIWGGRIGNPKASGPPKFLSYSDLCVLFRGMDRITEETAERAGVEHVNLQRALASRLGVFYDHAHVAEDGAELTAQTIADCLLQRGSH